MNLYDQNGEINEPCEPDESDETTESLRSTAKDLAEKLLFLVDEELEDKAQKMIDQKIDSKDFQEWLTRVIRAEVIQIMKTMIFREVIHHVRITVEELLPDVKKFDPST